MTRRLPALLAAAGTALAVTVPAPAFAESASHSDARHDVLRRTNDGTVAAPHNHTADITTSSAAHRRKTVTGTLHVRDLSSQWIAIWLIKTSKSAGWAVGVDHLDGDHGVELLKDHQQVPCDGITKQVHAKTDAVSFSVPRSCLHRPSWVRVEADFSAFTDGREYADNGQRDGELNETSIAYGPRLSRG